MQVPINFTFCLVVRQHKAVQPRNPAVTKEDLVNVRLSKLLQTPAIILPSM
jgi:hypothetical protein